MATIKDVAKRARVSVGTVSNILSGKETVSDEKYVRIKEAMQELNYRPSYMARNLKSQKSKVIGIILPSLNEPYNDIYAGLVDKLEMKDYIVVLKLTQNNIVLENLFLKQLEGMGATGIIIIPSDCNNLEKYKEIEETGITFVFVERKINGGYFSSITFDNKKLIYDLTVSILENNKDNDIKLFVGKQDFSNEKDCLEGYLAARPDREADIAIIKESDKEAIFDHIYRKIISFEVLPEHIIASSLEFAKILVEICNILGYKISIHAIVGEKWYTTDVYQNMVLYGRNAIFMGKQAAGLLEELMSNKHLAENRNIVIPSKKKYCSPKVGSAYREGKTLRVLAFQCDSANALEKLSYSYKNLTGINIEFDKRDYTDLKRELTRQCETQSSEYDIYMMDIPWLRGILAKDYLANIATQVKEDDLLKLYPKGIRSAFYKGDRGVHLLPIIATIQVIMYRKDIFSNQDIRTQFMKKYGFELSAPKTWTNFNIIAEFFDKSCNPYSPFNYGTAATALEPIGLINEFLPRQWAFHGSIVDQWGNLSIDSEENVRALENLVTTFEHVPRESEGLFWDEIFELLIKGEIPMAHGFASHYQPGNYSQIGTTYEKYIGEIALPSSKTMLGGWALGINKCSVNIKESYDFIKWNLNDKIVIANMRLCGCTPTLTAFKDDTLKGRYQWLGLVNDRFDIGGLREELFDKNKNAIDIELVDNILSGGIKQAIHKEITPEEALQKVKKDLAILIQ